MTSRWTILAVLLAGQFIANVDTAIVNVALPAIGGEFHASGALLQLVATGYVISSTALLVTCARLGKLFGVGRVFFAGAATFTAASLACGLAPSVAALIVARLVQGAGAAAMVAQVFTGIQLHFPGPVRRRAIGLFTLTLSLSAVIGQVLGGALVTADLFGSSWRAVFLINLPIGIGLVAFGARSVPSERVDVSGGIDRIGVALISVALLGSVVPLTLGRELGWPPWTFASLAVAVGAAAAAAWWEVALERRGGAPIVRPEVVGVPTFALGSGAVFLARSCYFAMLFVLALFLQDGLHRSPLQSGLALLPWVASYGLGGPAFARFAGPQAAAALRAARLGAGLTAGAYALLAFAAWSGNDVLLEIALGCGGFGFAVMSSAVTYIVTSAVAAAYASEASGVLAMLVPLAGVVGVTLFGGLYLALLGGGAPRPALALVAAAFAGATALAALALLVLRPAADARER